MNKALLPLLLCCFIFPASGKDAGWQWYNEKINPKEKENKPVPAAPRQEPDIILSLWSCCVAETGRAADGNKAGAVRSHSVSRRG
ncbi:hypothetical protein EIMP300_00270 [Escherichia coli]|uniref:Type-F conjugative transfer system pilin assembly protein TraF n=1 Tax=Escherichia coli TaxID=562 RepID=A0A8S0FEB1_ECOLX|nr:hypothetical protein EIMP300_00270 [Escherichia coli]